MKAIPTLRCPPETMPLSEVEPGVRSQKIAKTLYISMLSGGEGGIRTPGTVARTPHFECGAIDHSATSPWSRRQLAPVDGPLCIQRRQAKQERRRNDRDRRLDRDVQRIRRGREREGMQCRYCAGRPARRAEIR